MRLVPESYKIPKYPAVATLDITNIEHKCLANILTSITIWNYNVLTFDIT